MESFSETGQIFDTKEGENVPLPRPQLSPGDELVAAACTVTTVSGDPRIVYAVTARTPSQGLTPEKEKTTIYSFDAKSAQPVLVKDWPQEISGIERLHPGVDGSFLALGGLYSDTVAAVFDAQTLLPRVNTLRSVGVGHDVSMDANFAGYAITYDKVPGVHLGGVSDAHFISAKDGSEIGEFSNVGRVVALPRGFLLEHSNSQNADATEPPTGVFYFDMDTRETVGPIAPFLDGFDTDDGGSSTYDDILMLHCGSLSSSYLQIYNLTTRKPLFGLNNDQLEGLRVEGLDVGGQYLYMTNESDNPVIDLYTSQSVSSSWKLRPVAKFADGWVLIQPSAPHQSDDLQRRYLARAAAGDYAGPWF